MVLGQGIKASGYAGHLVSVAREFRTAGLRPWVAIAMAHPSSLDQRVQYVLDATVRRAGLSRRGLCGVALSVAAVVLAVPSLDAGGQAAAAPNEEHAVQDTASALRVEAAASVQKARAMQDRDFEAAGRRAEQAAAELYLLAQAQEAPPDPNPPSEDRLEFELKSRDIEQHMEHAKRNLAEISKRMAWAQGTAPHKIWANMEGGEPRLSPEALQTASAALRKALGSSNASVRSQAAESLGQLGSPEAANLEALGKAVSDSEPQVQKAAVEALGQVLSQDHDIPGEVALDYLKPALASPNVEVRREAVGALRGLRGAAAIKAAVQMADDADLGVQREAIESLGDLLSDADAETAKASLPVLQKGLQSKDPSVRRQIVEALGGLHSIADQVVPLLAKAAEDPDPGVQREAVEALGRISAGAGFHKPWAHFVRKDSDDLHPKFAADAR
jgi:HEAT repeat protein